MPDDAEKKAADLAFDLTKQFLTLATGGVAFVIGLSSASPGLISTGLFWGSIIIFVLSSACGLILLMSAVYQLQEKKIFDVYTVLIRGSSLAQIGFFFIGLIIVATFIGKQPPKPLPALGMGDSVNQSFINSCSSFSKEQPPKYSHSGHRKQQRRKQTPRTPNCGVINSGNG